MTLTDQVSSASDQALALKITGLNGNAVGANTAMILVSYNRTANQVQVRTLEPGQCLANLGHDYFLV